MLECSKLHSFANGLFVDALELEIGVDHVKEVGRLVLVDQRILLEQQL